MPSPAARESSQFTLCENGRSWNFVKPANPDAVLDAVPERLFDEQRFLPYWAELWPASEVLFSFLERRIFPRTHLICDLGCGLGVASACLIARGHSVVSLDISLDSCAYTRANTLRYAKRSCAVCASWHNPPFSRPFGLVVASDILYEDQCLDPVCRFLSLCLAPAGRALIADPCRPQWPVFKQKIEALGMSHRVAHRAVINGGKTTVEILEIRAAG
jgi:SAM-dependent methyltransferase